MPYLKPNVQIEPLINQWHAHPYLIAPQTAGLFMSKAHLSILTSYLQMPMAHAAAVKNPNMVGGPFIDLGGGKVDEVKQLKADTTENAAGYIELAGAIEQLFTQLEGHTGMPLASAYDEIPQPLQGLVELNYDVLHRPSFRFFEPLVYGEHFNKQLQSVALSLVDSDQRPFIFSTPRVADDNIIHLPFAFDSQQLKQLYQLQYTDNNLGELMEQFQIPEHQRELFCQMFWDKPPTPRQNYQDEGVRVRYYGHACILFETKDVSILVDPLISYVYPTELERYTFDDLPEHIDYVLITHAHHDHIELEALLRLRDSIGTIVVPRAGGGSLQDPCMKQVLTNIGFDSVVTIDDMECLNFEGGMIQGIPFLGEHCDLAIQTKSVFHVRLQDKGFLIFADSSSLSATLYEHVKRQIDNIDAIFIGMEAKGAPLSWAYGPLFPQNLERSLDKKRRSNGSDAESASRLAHTFEVDNVFLYAMGQEPWLSYVMALHKNHEERSAAEIEKLGSLCADAGIGVETLVVKAQWHY